jgi:hypothetical protein
MHVCVHGLGATLVLERRLSVAVGPKLWKGVYVMTAAAWRPVIPCPHCDNGWHGISGCQVAADITQIPFLNFGPIAPNSGPYKTMSPRAVEMVSLFLIFADFKILGCA